MKDTIQYLLVIAAVVLTAFSLSAQNVSINANGAAPDPSAMLDVSDTTRGFLPPRLSTTQMNAITSPASGLFVYNTDSLGYLFYNGTNWVTVTTSGETKYSVPAGTIIPFGGDKANLPTGFLFCDGSLVSTTTYSDLFSAIGYAWGGSGASFNLPDLRGRFLRGVDDGAGNDPDVASRTAINTGGNTGDNVGSTQDDNLQGHQHPIWLQTQNAAGDGGNRMDGNAGLHAINATRTSGYVTSVAGKNVYQNYATDGTNGTPRTGSETRPKNAAVTYIICYSSSIAAAGGSGGFQGNITANQITGSINDTLISESISDSTRITDTDGDTKIQVEEGADDDIIRFYQSGTEFFRMDSGRIEVLNAKHSIAIGQEAGNNFTRSASGSSNIAIGSFSNRNGIGRDNITVGFNTMQASTSANENVAIGSRSLEDITSGGGNTGVGAFAARDFTTGSRNTGIGRGTFGFNTTGSDNVAIGNLAGLSTSGSNNVFIGAEAGTGFSGSDALFIENSNSNAPLIYGDFATDSLVINGVLTIDSLKDGSGYTLPGVDGTIGQYLQTDGSGKLNWVNSTGASPWGVSGTDIYYSTGGIAVGATSLTAGYKQEIVNTGGAVGGGLLINNNAGGNTLKTGIEINISNGGNLQKYGTITRVIGKNNQADSLFGHYTEITPDAVSASTFAYKAKFNGTDGDNWGVFMENEDQNYFSGSVGIGVENPTALLELNNAINPRKIAIYTMADNDHQFLGFGTAFGELRYQVDQPTTDHVFYAGTSTTTSSELFRITGDGNIGMGTSTPVLNLVVTDSTANSVIGIHAANTSGDAYVSYISNGSAQFVSGYDLSSNTFKIAPSIASNSFVVNSSGNVGIGTDNPSELLHISTSNGDAQILLEADTDNNAEADNPRLLFSQDGGAVSGFVGFEGTAGTFSANTISNALLMSTVGNWPLQFGTNSTVNMTILEDGKVGIGNSNPERSIHVSSTEYVTSVFESSSVTGTWLTLENTSAGGRFHQLISTGSGNPAGAGKLHFGYGPTDAAISDISMTLDEGDVGIGTRSPTHRLEIVEDKSNGYLFRIENENTSDNADGMIIAIGRTANMSNNNKFIAFEDGTGTDLGLVRGNGSGGINFFNASDRRLKSNISDLEGALPIIMKMRPRTYSFKTAKGIMQDGFIAQELKEVYPQVVAGEPDGDVKEDPMMVDYSAITPLLTKAIQEQQKEIIRLKLENEKFRLRLEQIEAKILEENAK